jgi:hypothetical protein
LFPVIVGQEGSIGKADSLAGNRFKGSGIGVGQCFQVFFRIFISIYQNGGQTKKNACDYKEKFTFFRFVFLLR